MVADRLFLLGIPVVLFSILCLLLFVPTYLTDYRSIADKMKGTQRTFWTIRRGYAHNIRVPIMSREIHEVARTPF